MFLRATAKTQVISLGQAKETIQVAKKESIAYDHLSRHWKLGFRMEALGSTWEDRLSRLADYQSRHCNVPLEYSENTKLGGWVHTKGSIQVAARRKDITDDHLRIQDWKRLGFGGSVPLAGKKGTRKYRH
jgi:hypothetical protein